MSIRPIDMQTIIPQMEKTDAARNKAINKTDNTNQQNLLKAKQEAEAKSKQVSTLEQKDHNAVKNDERERSKNKAHLKSIKKDAEDDEDEDGTTRVKNSKILRGHFDMKI